ncbi:MAG: hypothetical protein RR676_11140 [Acinetobacter sp.]
MELSNYKIKVTTEAESEEVCNQMGQLGLSKRQFTGFGFPCVIAVYGNEYSDFTLRNREIRNSKELTLPQLRDLVVLHRNDVSDATHGRNNGEMFGYLSSDNIEYTWNFVKNNWFKSSIYFSVSGLKPINQGLISGADALRALADGEDVEYSYVGDWLVVDLKTELGIFHRTDVAFRLKPSTITLNIEIPAPFEPTECEEFYVLSSIQPSGYIKTHVKKQAFLGLGNLNTIFRKLYQH